MPANGHRFRLILYAYVLNRWWRSLLGIGIVLLVLALGLGLAPRLLPQVHLMQVDEQVLWAAGGIGGLAIGLSIFLIAIRKSAYVQAFSDHLRLVTPFLRVNIAYRRIRQTSSIEMDSLFPLATARGWRRSFLRPLAKHTAIVLDLAALPLSRAALSLFLSPYFFPDKAPRVTLLVQNWMAFSTELESFRSAWVESQRARTDPSASIFASGPNSRS
jgi:hypothetical protein